MANQKKRKKLPLLVYFFANLLSVCLKGAKLKGVLSPKRLTNKKQIEKLRSLSNITNDYSLFTIKLPE